MPEACAVKSNVPATLCCGATPKSDCTTPSSTPAPFALRSKLLSSVLNFPLAVTWPERKRASRFSNWTFEPLNVAFAMMDSNGSPLISPGPACKSALPLIAPGMPVTLILPEVGPTAASSVLALPVASPPPSCGTAARIVPMSRRSSVASSAVLSLPARGTSSLNKAEPPP